MALQKRAMYAMLQLRPTLLDKSSSETNCWISFSVIFRAKLTKSSTALYKCRTSQLQLKHSIKYIHLHHYPTLQHTPHSQKEVISLQTSLPFHDILFSWSEKWGNKVFNGTMLHQTQPQASTVRTLPCFTIFTVGYFVMRNTSRHSDSTVRHARMENARDTYSTSCVRWETTTRHCWGVSSSFMTSVPIELHLGH